MSEQTRKIYFYVAFAWVMLWTLVPAVQTVSALLHPQGITAEVFGVALSVFVVFSGVMTMFSSAFVYLYVLPDMVRKGFGDYILAIQITLALILTTAEFIAVKNYFATPSMDCLVVTILYAVAQIVVAGISRKYATISDQYIKKLKPASFERHDGGEILTTDPLEVAISYIVICVGGGEYLNSRGNIVRSELFARNFICAGAGFFSEQSARWFAFDRGYVINN